MSSVRAFRPLRPPARNQNRFLPGESAILARSGALETRFACRESEIEAAQAVRYRVFCKEMGASMSVENRITGRDTDGYDRNCDHLLLLDTDIDGPAEKQIVGTYRLLTDDMAVRNDGFYSATEFTVDELLGRHPGKRFMELGRSCVLPAYRKRRALELLWQGNWAHVRRHGIDVMFGCASFPGIDPAEHALALSFLHRNYTAPPEWLVSVLPGHHCSMDRVSASAIDARAALAAMPPLIKGYLRLGAMVGDGAFVDHAFRTTDVMIVLPTGCIHQRYLNRFGVDDERRAANGPGDLAQRGGCK